MFKLLLGVAKLALYTYACIYHRHAIAHLAKEFAAIRRLPSVVRDVLVCLADQAQPLVAKLGVQIC